MIVNGFYEKRDAETGEIKRYRNCRFESTGIKFEDGHVIWRKIKKDGTPLNVFAIQFIPNVPWAIGKWFVMVDGGEILRQYPQLKVDTEKSISMTHDEYCKFLSSTYCA